MTTLDVTVALANYVAIVEMNRPPNNYLDIGVIEGIADAYERLDHDDQCRAIILCAKGKHFCAGADFSPSTDNTISARDLYQQALRLFRTHKPVIAAVRGAAIGGGLGLALSADFRVASPQSRFAANFSQLGLHPGFGITETLPRVVGAQLALEWLLTGVRIGGETAYATGLVDKLADNDTDVQTLALSTAEHIAASAPLAVRSIRATMRTGLAEAVEGVIGHELREQTRLQATADFHEGVVAAMQRRSPRFAGR
jgi:enoyl-CoA hydratase/carnithine racemase